MVRSILYLYIYVHIFINIVVFDKVVFIVYMFVCINAYEFLWACVSPMCMFALTFSTY